jgi:hypothetical protein
MIFRRSAGGLASLYIFYKVDKVVFCEGGKQLSIPQIQAGGGDEYTLDISYWTRVLSFIGASGKYHFKSVGNKANLLSIAQDILGKSTDTIIVCLDRDFDFHIGINLVHKNILYTYGYSWENDVTSTIVIERIISKFIMNVSKCADASSLILKSILSLANATRWCEVDITLVARGKEALILRKSPLRFVDQTKPVLRMEESQIRTRLKELGYTRAPKRIVKIPGDECLRHTCGKLVGVFIYHSVIKVIRRYSKDINLNYETFMQIAIEESFVALKLDQLHTLRDYYSSMSGAFIL